MGKNKHRGGSGRPHSTLEHYIRGTKKKYFSPNGRGVIFTPEDVADYFGDADRLECLECGRFYKLLTRHVSLSHAMSRDEYCIKHSIPIGTALICNASSSLMSEAATERMECIMEGGDEVARQKIKKAMDYGHQLIKKIAQERAEGICPKCGIVHPISKHRENTGDGKAMCPKCKKIALLSAIRRNYYKHGEIEALCAVCEKDFIAVGKNALNIKNGLPTACSRRCKSILHVNKFYSRDELAKRLLEPLHRIAKVRVYKVYDKVCAGCKKTFTTDRKHRKYCSVQCTYDSNAQRVRNMGHLGGKKRAEGKRDSSGKFIQEIQSWKI